jgi:ATP-binding cassette, subfamily F, member 3
VLEFSHGTMRTYLGSLGDYLYKKKMDKEAMLHPGEPGPAEQSQRTSSSEPSYRSLSKQARQQESNRLKQLNKKLQPLKKKVEAIESEVQKLEAKKVTLEMTLADPEIYKRRHEARSSLSEYKEVQQSLEAKYAEWSSLAEEMAKMEKSP